MKHGKKQVSMVHIQGKKETIETAVEVQQLNLAISNFMNIDLKTAILKMFKELKKKKKHLSKGWKEKISMFYQIENINKEIEII